MSMNDSIKEVERLRLINDNKLMRKINHYKLMKDLVEDLKEDIDNQLKDCKNKLEDLV